MDGVWSNKWKKCLIWFSSYISFIAFALVGGYVIVKDEDEELKKTTKTAFFVALIFACVSAFFVIFNNFAGMSDSYYNSGAYDFYSISTRLIGVAEIVTYAVFIILEFVKKDNCENVPAVAESKDKTDDKATAETDNNSEAD